MSKQQFGLRWTAWTGDQAVCLFFLFLGLTFFIATTDNDTNSSLSSFNQIIQKKCFPSFLGLKLNALFTVKKKAPFPPKKKPCDLHKNLNNKAHLFSSNHAHFPQFYSFHLTYVHASPLLPNHVIYPRPLGVKENKDLSLCAQERAGESEVRDWVHAVCTVGHQVNIPSLPAAIFNLISSQSCCI